MVISYDTVLEEHATSDTMTDVTQLGKVTGYRDAVSQGIGVANQSSRWGRVDKHRRANRNCHANKGNYSRGGGRKTNKEPLCKHGSYPEDRGNMFL
jgi:hypothetical protein